MGKIETRRVDEILKHIQGPAILDIGCAGQVDLRSDFNSPYWLHGRILARHVDAVGMEYSSESAAELREHGLNVIQGDAQNFDLGRKFNTIVAGEVIEHLPDPGAFLRSCVNNLEVDGRVVLSTPYVFSLPFVIYAWLKYPKTNTNPEHRMWFCPTTLEQIARASGLEIESRNVVMDYRRDLNPTGRLIGLVARFLRYVLPKRVICNTMVIVLRALN